MPNDEKIINTLDILNIDDMKLTISPLPLKLLILQG
jgi:hypothetical protein